MKNEKALEVPETGVHKSAINELFSLFHSTIDKEDEIPTKEIDNTNQNKHFDELKNNDDVDDKTKSQLSFKIMNDEEENIFHLPKIHLRSNKKKKKKKEEMKSSKVYFPKINKQSSSSTPIKEERKIKTNKLSRRRIILPKVSLGQQNLTTTKAEHEMMCLNTTSDALNKSRCSTMMSSRRSLACLLLDESIDTKDTGYNVVKTENDSLIEELVVSGRSFKF